jgi:hypothetical protein
MQHLYYVNKQKNLSSNKPLYHCFVDFNSIRMDRAKSGYTGVPELANQI